MVPPDSLLKNGVKKMMVVFIVVTFPSKFFRECFRNDLLKFLFYDADSNIVDGNNSNNAANHSEITSSQHVIVCATQEIASLMRSLGTAASPLIADRQTSKHSSFDNFLSFNIELSKHMLNFGKF